MKQEKQRNVHVHPFHYYHIHIYTHAHIYVYTNIYMHTYIYTCIYIYICIHMCANMYTVCTAEIRRMNTQPPSPLCLPRSWAASTDSGLGSLGSSARRASSSFQKFWSLGLLILPGAGLRLKVEGISTATTALRCFAALDLSFEKGFSSCSGLKPRNPNTLSRNILRPSTGSYERLS